MGLLAPQQPQISYFPNDFSELLNRTVEVGPNHARRIHRGFAARTGRQAEDRHQFATHLYQRPYPVTVIAAHLRWVREAIRSGICMSLFQASQQASTTAL